MFINVPFLYLAFYKITYPFFTKRTKSKFFFAGPSKTVETLFRFIAPELVLVQYGDLCHEGEQECIATDSVIEEIIKPATTYYIELSVTEKSHWKCRDALLQLLLSIES